MNGNYFESIIPSELMTDLSERGRLTLLTYMYLI